MPDYWSVPISTGSIDNLNETIAKGPNLDFINNLANSYFQGKDQAYTQANRDVFKQGLPKDAQGNIDWNQVSEQLARVGGTGQTQNLVNLQNLQLGREAIGKLGSSDIFSPIGSGQQSAPTTALAPPSSATAVPNSVPRQQPVSNADIPAGSPASPGQNITGPNTTVSRVDYGPVQNGPLPPQGQPPVQMAQNGPAAPVVSPPQAGPAPGMNEATAQLYDKRAADAARMATALAFSNPKQAEVLKALSDQWAKQSQIIRGALAKNSETTPEQKNTAASGSGTPLNYEGAKEVNKQDVDAFNKRNTGIQALGEASFNGLQKAQLMKQLTLDPNFYSGPFHEGVQTYNQFKSIFGANPSSALPQEAFNKVTNDMLTEQVKSMGQSGVGRVLQSEVNIMRQAIASLGITPQSNRALAEILSRVYQQQQDIAGLARGVPQQAGQMNRSLDTQISGYLKSHPLFTADELQHPQLLGAPDAPPQSANWSPQQRQAWARSIGLKSGDPIRFNGQIGQVQ